MMEGDPTSWSPSWRTALRWDGRTLVLALIASVPPLATLWFERWAERTGRLGAPVRAAEA